MDCQSRLQALRAVCADEGVDGYWVPHHDAFFNEYTPPCDERLAFVTGFTGSAGEAVILPDRAAVFSDTRYELQLKQQIDPALFEAVDSHDPGITEWIKAVVTRPLRLGYDPHLLSLKTHQQWERDWAQTGVTLVPIDRNLVDALWGEGRPARIASAVVPFPNHIAGKTSLEKRRMIGNILGERDMDAVYIADPQSVAWLLNIRGSDIAGTPVALSRLLVRVDGAATWWIDPARVSADVMAHVGGDVRIVQNAAAFFDGMADQTVLVDPGLTSLNDARALRESGACITEGDDPCLMPRAQKTDPEIAAMREAHRRDAVAMITFLAGLQPILQRKAIREDELADLLRAVRALDPAFTENSFDAIIGWNANGAIVHYKPGSASASVAGPGLLLIDSGGQYLNMGTTDVTRTVAVGRILDDHRAAYTAVLRAHLAVSMARFPAGTKGVQIDALARAPLWDAGLDYGHGTGHGVGCYLSVHEPSASLSPKGDKALLPGMVLSNEPGYYKSGAYGIRIENLCVVEEQGTMAESGKMRLGFDTLTLVPYDRTLINWTALSVAEIRWIRGYYENIRTDIRPRLKDPDVIAWLDQALAIPA